MVKKEEKVYIQFKEHKPVKLPSGKMSTPPAKLDFGNGEYRRSFRRDEQPFAVTEEEAQILKNSGLFVDADPPGEAGREDESEMPADAETGATDDNAGEAAVDHQRAAAETQAARSVKRRAAKDAG